jgi:hypothetical protein
VACSPSGQTQAAKRTAQTEAAKNINDELLKKCAKLNFIPKQFAFMQYYTAVAGILVTKTY